MARLFIFGLGYTAQRIKASLEMQGWQIDATGSAGNLDFANGDAVRAAIAGCDHVLSSVPPDRKGGEDAVLEAYAQDIAGKRLAYLSSTGVYGDAGGAWVDESSPTGAGRRNARTKADARWMAMDARVFRLPGIYGPGRSALDRVREGKSRRIDLPDQVFSRCQVDDIASGVVTGLRKDAPPGAYNLSDDLPTNANEVTEYACALLGIAAPPLETLERANLSEMARGFYAENRRVANGKAKRVLGWRPQYPTYVEGLRSLLGAGQESA
ncbi:MAG: SDR family NAD(P)-dependent oxidoreductase [Erythrobacter sp.]